MINILYVSSTHHTACHHLKLWLYVLYILSFALIKILWSESTRAKNNEYQNAIIIERYMLTILGRAPTRGVDPGGDGVIPKFAKREA